MNSDKFLNFIFILHNIIKPFKRLPFFEIKFNLMSKILTTDDVNLVKFDNNKYYVYTYRSKLNDAKDSLIALCWPKEALFKDDCLRAFIDLFIHKNYMAAKVLKLL